MPSQDRQGTTEHKHPIHYTLFPCLCQQPFDDFERFVESNHVFRAVFPSDGHNDAFSLTQKPAKARKSTTAGQPGYEPQKGTQKSLGVSLAAVICSGCRSGTCTFQNTVGFQYHIRFVRIGYIRVPTHDKVCFLKHTAISRPNDDHVLLCASEHSLPPSLPTNGDPSERIGYSIAGKGRA